MERYNIDLNIEKEADLYDPFDSDKNLSGDVKDYMIRKARMATIKNPISINIRSASPVNEEDVKNSFYKWVEEENTAIRLEHHRNSMKQLWMFLVGVAFIAVSLILEPMINRISFTVLSTIGAFAMWEAASVWIVQNPGLRLRKMLFRRISESGEVNFFIKDEAGEEESSAG